MDDLNLYNMTLSLFDREITQDDLDSTTPSKEVRLCKRYHNIAILRVLREFDWSFLVTRILIDEEDDAGQDYGFIHGYKLPAGLLKVVHAFTDYPYEVRGAESIQITTSLLCTELWRIFPQRGLLWICTNLLH